MDNITYTATFEYASNYLGLPSSEIYLIIGLATLLLLSLIIYSITHSILFVQLTTINGIWAGWAFGFIPLWISFLASLMFAATTAYYIYARGEPTGETSTIGDYWVDYGNRIKSAYTAKFGGGNSEFNKEVDAHVSVMQNNGKGITRSLAREWIERYAKFAESK